ncbi:MAG: hypothetical protein ABR953_10375 [Candidatus Acidiferrales bacterium]|jgi:hypothetical protein
MTRDKAIAKLVSVRHYCFVRGVLGKHPDSDFRQAFRTLNRLYVEARYDIALKRRFGVGRATQARRRAAA